MTDVTVLGLGSMGTAQTRALLGRGHSVTVWNRTPEKVAAIVSEGAQAADTVATAVAASPLVIMCVYDYDAAQTILDLPGVEDSIRGKTLVQLSTGMPAQVLAQQEWIHERGAHFIAGGIMAYPNSIGQPNCVILYAGDRQFESHRATLAALGGSLQYLGSDPAVVVGAYFTLSSFMIGSLGLFFETAAIAERYGISMDSYYLMARLIVDEVLNGMKDGAHRVSTGRFDGNLASIDLTASGMQAVVDTFKKTGIPAIMTEALVAQLQLASANGGGTNDISYLTRSLLSQTKTVR